MGIMNFLITLIEKLLELGLVRYSISVNVAELLFIIALAVCFCHAVLAMTGRLPTTAPVPAPPVIG